MLCPSCRTGCAADDVFCRRCGTDLSIPSKSLVPTQTRLPTTLYNPQLPRLAAGVGALAVGVGLELLRRSLLARMARPARSSAKLLPALSPRPARELFTGSKERTTKLPRGYEIHETMVYVSRVIRRGN